MHPPILLVEDDESHALLVERVLGGARLANRIVTFRNGDDAVAYLERAGEGAEALPALVLTDFHVHGRNGLDVLAWIRKQPGLEEVPVVMYSGSGGAENINRAFELGVDAYLVKPVAFDALLDAIDDLKLPWALLPKAEERGEEA
ncbi:MAG: response regulator [Actinomycetota bacterium]